jgi:hypothetical protein
VKKIPNSLVYAFAIIGVCAVIYAGWTVYQRQVAPETRRPLSAPVPPGLPNIFRNAPPPPQPH